MKTLVGSLVVGQSFDGKRTKAVCQRCGIRNNVRAAVQKNYLCRDCKEVTRGG